MTFTGARHRIVLEVEESPALRHWLAALPELELKLAGHLVADLVVAALHAQDGQARATLEALTVEEC
ncbi:hypothetical protein [Sphingomonas sp. TDK1]|uniref:hypothetical protein n=1 Tax=Sphingomonas sp. TDK1 TaxID=453247 RepID=UPI001E30E0D9|nr:hypothetical protein [Sphingomonas sp. TDK1]